MAANSEKITITTNAGTQVEAVAPVIISASRSTDIPAFHGEWFASRLRAGYVTWINPFNNTTHYVSFARTRVIVFWTKNFAPMEPIGDEVDRRGIGWYVQHTVNDYDDTGLEPNVPPLAARIESFKRLSSRIGRDRVIWRFDPLVCLGADPVSQALERIRRTGDLLAGYTSKLVFSFADIEAYAKVRRNMDEGYREFMVDEMRAIAAGIKDLCECWGLRAATCAEKIDVSALGIDHNRCIDDDLLAALYPGDAALMQFLGRLPAVQTGLFDAQQPQIPAAALKDKGQRKECGCIVSKDIGAYNTCGHLCRYCYANFSEAVVKKEIWR